MRAIRWLFNLITWAIVLFVWTVVSYLDLRDALVLRKHNKEKKYAYRR